MYVSRLGGEGSGEGNCEKTSHRRASAGILRILLAVAFPDIPNYESSMAGMRHEEIRSRGAGRSEIESQKEEGKPGGCKQI